MLPIRIFSYSARNFHCSSPYFDRRSRGWCSFGWEPAWEILSRNPGNVSAATAPELAVKNCRRVRGKLYCLGMEDRVSLPWEISDVSIMMRCDAMLLT